NLAIALVLGGALGNLIDRLVLSYVVDFLLFYIKTDSFQYYYPAFNVADIAVCTGAFLLVVIGLFGKEQKGSK
ncbi:MAG TPA: signal peptidase II, partial [Succinivibrio sp.]|nr:signal peptidase II [Succinivibrio sp.]